MNTLFAHRNAFFVAFVYSNKKNSNPKCNCILRSGIFMMNQITMLNYAKLNDKKGTTSFIRHIHHVLFEFILPAQNITRMATFLMFHIFYCFVVVCFSFVFLLCMASFSWGHTFIRYEPWLKRGICISSNNQPKHNCNDATRTSTVHSHIYTSITMRLCLYTLHNFYVQRRRKFSFALNPPDVCHHILYN